ncbi:hypothetical protein [Halobacillus sp. B29]|uniref:hypothetical protein n=1 Tax=Halobacillus sp. B29 TaxID=3457432 RepID=UPI003FCEDC4D
MGDWLQYLGGLWGIMGTLLGVFLTRYWNQKDINNKAWKIIFDEVSPNNALLERWIKRLEDEKEWLVHGKYYVEPLTPLYVGYWQMVLHNQPKIDVELLHELRVLSYKLEELSYISKYREQVKISGFSPMDITDNILQYNKILLRKANECLIDNNNVTNKVEQKILEIEMRENRVNVLINKLLSVYENDVYN